MLRIPGTYFTTTTEFPTPDQSSYAAKLKTVMEKLKAIPPRQQKHQHVNVGDLLQTCTHVFVRHDAIRKPLETLYNDPYQVLTHSKKHFNVNVKGCKEVISIDRLKPAYLNVTTASEAISLPHPSPPTSTVSEPPPKLKGHHTTTRSSCQVRWPTHLT